MSDTKSIMKFELLPNEILIECFEYLNAFDIFHSFDQLNSRLNNLIRHIPLCIYFQNTNKSIFDEFCTKMIRNPQIKNQIYSLNLPNEDEYLQFKTFLSVFYNEDFPNLQKIQSILPLPTDEKFITDYRERPGITIEVPDKLMMKLRKFSISQLDDWFAWYLDELSITNLTIFALNLRYFYYVLKHFPMLKYLHIHDVRDFHYLMHSDEDNTEISFNSQCSLHLKKLIISNFSDTFEDFEMYVKQIPNLRSLTISTSSEDMIDASRLEQLITTSLPYLTSFKFKLYILHFPEEQKDNIIVKLRQFQTDFWQEQHPWFTEFQVGKDSAFIYTIPDSSNMFSLSSYYKTYCIHEKNSVNTLVNVTELILYQEKLTPDCEYYFPNVTSLTLQLSFWECITIEQTEHLKKIVNPFNLKHLVLNHKYFIPINSSVLLEIFKLAPQLFSLTVSWVVLKIIFNDSELCKYLNKMITKLYIPVDHDVPIDNSFDAEQFCEVFSNLEYLRCGIDREKKLPFLLIHLPKLFNLYLHWTTRRYNEEYLSRLENEVLKQNIIYNIDIKQFITIYTDDDEPPDENMRPQTAYDIIVLMWFDKNIL